MELIDITRLRADLKHMITTLFQVALGGALGAVARWLTGMGVYRVFGPGFPSGVVIVNVVGSLAMGAFVVYANQRGSTHLSPFVMTGMLGGFTTFSAFSLDVVTLMERGELLQAAVYIVLSVGGAVGALFVGMVVMRAIVG